MISEHTNGSHTPRLVVVALAALIFTLNSCSQVSANPDEFTPERSPTSLRLVGDGESTELADPLTYVGNNPVSDNTVDYSCPVTPPQENFWDPVGPVAGTYPVWMTSLGRISWSSLGPQVLAPESKETPFAKGRLTKLILFVDKEVGGDLRISGRQLDGPNNVYFPSSSITKRIDETTLQLLATPPDFLILEDAQISTNFPAPPGKSQRGWGALFPGAGCYEFAFEIGEYVVPVVLLIVDG